VAAIFFGHVRTIESVCGWASGISDPVADEYAVDAATFATFVQTLSDARASSNHGVFILEVHAVLTICAAL
jgi:Family of unknown function (DUF6086)